MLRFLKKALWPITLDEWGTMSEEAQAEVYKKKGIRTDIDAAQPPKPRSRRTFASKPQPQTQPKQQTQKEPKQKTEETISRRVGKLRNWNEAVTTKEGGIIPGSRLRDCIIFLLDVRKDPWYTMRLTRGFVMRNAAKIDADVPEDANLYTAENPLLGMRRIRTEDYEVMISTIERQPSTEEERVIIREKFGVTSSTISYLAKKDCEKCKGAGLYEVSSYPNDPVYRRLTESVECGCSYE
jgi:hypothetical protein